MKKKLKILTVDRKTDNSYWIAGIFDTDEEIDKYVELFLFDDAVFEVQEFEHPISIDCLPNGEYAYQVLVVNPTEFIIEHILAPHHFNGFHIDENPKMPIRIFISAKNAADVKQKCLKIMAAKLVL